MDRNFSDMLSELSAAGAEFLVVGAYALAAYGNPRATGDIDIWVRPTQENAERVFSALKYFGAPLMDLSVNDLSTPDIVFQMGVPPLRIDILTSIAGVEFEEAWCNQQLISVSGVPIPVVSYKHLLQNKRATGRAKDASDVSWLEEHRPEGAE